MRDVADDYEGYEADDAAFEAPARSANSTDSVVISPGIVGRCRSVGCGSSCRQILKPFCEMAGRFRMSLIISGLILPKSRIFNTEVPRSKIAIISFLLPAMGVNVESARAGQKI